MQTLNSTHLLFVFLIGVFPTSGEPSQKLDVFDSGKPFDYQSIPISSGKTCWQEKKADCISEVIKIYLSLVNSEKDRIRRNLLNLTIGYLYLNQKYFSKAEEILDKNIFGNFILEDYRLYFRAIALKELGKEILKNKKYTAAVKRLNKSIQILLRIYQSYPDSPFHSNLNQDIAETEHLLGETYFQAMNYKKAWQTYRRALMREFPGNDEHRLEVNLDLAKTYTAVGNLQETIDIYAYLLSWVGNDSRVQKAVNDFILQFEKILAESNISIKELVDNLGRENSDKNLKKELKKTHDEGPKFEDPVFQKFYESLDREDFPSTVRWAGKVLGSYPGTEASNNVLQLVNRMVLKYLLKNSWNSHIDLLVSFYPSDILLEIAFRLWKNHQTESAAIFFQKIIEKYPLEIAMSHKALFFLGRINEDKGEYNIALSYYKRLLQQYNFGPYVIPSLFKVPWILRLEGKFKEAVDEFKNVIRFYGSKRYLRLDQAFKQSQSFLIASYYWLAQTYLDLGSIQEADQLRQKLIQDFPFSFYGIVSRGEMGINLSVLVDEKAVRVIAPRVMGLGDIQRKHLSRAEKLISVGLMDYGIIELNQVKIEEDKQLDFIFYLSKLYHRAGDFQKSLRLSWLIVKENQLSRLSQDLRDTLFPKAYLTEVKSKLNDSSLDPYIYLALMRQESAFNPSAISSANAIGLMQLLPSTARQVARSNNTDIANEEMLKNPMVNITLGIDYFKNLLKQFNQNIVYALASYNAGPHKVKEWVGLRAHLNAMEFIESIPYNETRGYVKKVLRNFYLYSAFYNSQSNRRMEGLLIQPGG